MLKDQSTSDKLFQGLLATLVWVLRPFLTQRPEDWGYSVSKEVLLRKSGEAELQGNS